MIEGHVFFQQIDVIASENAMNALEFPKLMMMVQMWLNFRQRHYLIANGWITPESGCIRVLDGEMIMQIAEGRKFRFTAICKLIQLESKVD